MKKKDPLDAESSKTLRKARWYQKFHVFPKDALLKSDQESLYTLTDYGTWLSNLKQIKILRFMLKVERT